MVKIPALFLAVLFGFQGLTAAPDPESFLEVIRLVESNNQPAAVGKLGERGAYQFRKQVWHQHTRSAFALAHNPSVADVVARRHFDWLVDALQAAGIRPTIEVLAICWNAGIGRILGGAVPYRANAYASRVAALLPETPGKGKLSTSREQQLFIPPVVMVSEVHFRAVTPL